MPRQLILLLALALLSMPVLAADMESIGEETQQLIVRAAYDRLSSYSVLADNSLDFEISGFETIYPSQFDVIRWMDIVSMPEGWVVNVNRAYKTNNNLNERRVVYEASWEERDPVWQNAPEASRIPGMSIADLLAETATGEVVAITAYDVEVFLGDDSRSYKAAFLWVPADAPAGFDTAFLVADNVTQGVEEAVREAVRPLTNPNFMSRTGELPRVPEKAVCSYSLTNFYSYGHANSSSWHIWGEHYSDADFKLTCRCDTNCYGHCYGGITSYACADTGMSLDWCHKMSSATDVSATTKYGGGAGCAAGLACGQKPCPFCLCGLSVGVSCNGVNVTFSSGDSNWTGHLQYSLYCQPCS